MRATILLASRIQNTALATATQRNQFPPSKEVVPNAR